MNVDIINISFAILIISSTIIIILHIIIYINCILQYKFGIQGGIFVVEMFLRFT